MAWLEARILAFPWSQFTRNCKNANCLRKKDLKLDDYDCWSQLTWHTGSRRPAPSRCPSGGSCPRVQTSPADPLWLGSRCCQSRRTGPAPLPSPCRVPSDCAGFAAGRTNTRVCARSEETEKQARLVFTLLLYKCKANRAHFLTLQVAFVRSHVNVFSPSFVHFFYVQQGRIINASQW